MWALHPLPQRCRSKVPWLCSSKTVMYRRGARGWRYAPDNLELFFLYIFSLALHFLLPLKKKIFKKKRMQAFEKWQIIWNTFWTFILKWGAEAACVATVRFGAELIIPNKKALLSVHTELGCWIEQLPQRLQFTNPDFIHFDLLLPSTVRILFKQ